MHIQSNVSTSKSHFPFWKIYCWCHCYPALFSSNLAMSRYGVSAWVSNAAFAWAAALPQLVGNKNWRRRWFAGYSCSQNFDIISSQFCSAWVWRFRHLTRELAAARANQRWKPMRTRGTSATLVPPPLDTLPGKKTLHATWLTKGRKGKGGKWTDRAKTHRGTRDCWLFETLLYFRPKRPFHNSQTVSGTSVLCFTQLLERGTLAILPSPPKWSPGQETKIPP